MPFSPCDRTLENPGCHFQIYPASSDWTRRGSLPISTTLTKRLISTTKCRRQCQCLANPALAAIFATLGLSVVFRSPPLQSRSAKHGQHLPVGDGSQQATRREPVGVVQGAETAGEGHEGDGGCIGHHDPGGDMAAGMPMPHRRQRPPQLHEGTDRDQVLHTCAKMVSAPLLSRTSLLADAVQV
jgi:hypothetical protein